MKIVRFKRIYRRIVLGSILVCLLLYFYMDTIIDFSVYREQAITPGYFVNTEGCHMLAMHALPESVLPFSQELASFECTLSMTEPQIMKTYGVNNITKITCIWYSVERYSDFKNFHNFMKQFRLEKDLGYVPIRKGVDIVRIKCELNEQTIYHDVHFFITPPPLKKRKWNNPEKPLSVMILGIDSISHMNFIRSMPQSADFLNKQLHVTFWGFNRVGLNTYPNLIPMFSGRSETEFEASCYQRKFPGFDNCDLIWKHFKAAGYNTSFGEDTNNCGLFMYAKWGFLKQPTDFYLQPVMMEIEQHTRYSSDKRELVHCSGRRKYLDILQEFIFNLLPHLAERPFFSFFWSMQGVHDYINYAREADTDYAHILRTLASQRILDNTVLLFMSDHGLRKHKFTSTYEGQLEQSNPMLTIIYPEWMQSKYPQAIKNLEYNSRSLVTTYDLHATLMNLLSIKELKDEHVNKVSAAFQTQSSALPRGISLFVAIPEIRTCEMAEIPAEYCLCHHLSELPYNDNQVQRAARFIVRKMNELLKGLHCKKLTLDTVCESHKLKRQLEDYHYEIKVLLQTRPGGGQFEGTVRFMNHKIALNGIVERINDYGNETYCAAGSPFKQYCYC